MVNTLISGNTVLGENYISSPPTDEESGMKTCGCAFVHTFHTPARKQAERKTSKRAFNAETPPRASPRLYSNGSTSPINLRVKLTYTED